MPPSACTRTRTCAAAGRRGATAAPLAPTLLLLLLLSDAGAAASPLRYPVLLGAHGLGSFDHLYLQGKRGA